MTQVTGQRKSTSIENTKTRFPIAFFGPKKGPHRSILRAIGVATMALVSALSQAQDKPQLAICMQQNDPPLSMRAGDHPIGFDLALSQTIAQRLGRDLRVQWFVSRDDPDSNMAKDTNALLSDNRCDLMAEYPLAEGTLQPPRSPTARLPPFDGAKPDDRRRWVKIGELAATRPYRLDTLTVVLSAHDASHQVRTLGDLEGLKIGVAMATLSDAIAMNYGDGRLREQVVHASDTRDLFTDLEAGGLDAALVDLRAFDAWRLRHESSALTPSGYRHSIGFNMGFVGQASNKALINQVDEVLADLLEKDALQPLAHSVGLTFIPPQNPAIQPDVRPSALNGD